MRLIAVLAVLTLFGCATPDAKYVATSSTMNLIQAQYVVRMGLQDQRLTTWGNAYYRVSDFRLRRDGIGLLVIQGHWTGGGLLDFTPSQLLFDAPPQLKICYYSLAADSPEVLQNSMDNSVYVRGLCDIDVWFSTLANATQFANALYVLKHNSN